MKTIITLIALIITIVTGSIPSENKKVDKAFYISFFVTTVGTMFNFIS